jgi:hypothetical protein
MEVRPLIEWIAERLVNFREAIEFDEGAARDCCATPGGRVGQGWRD